MEVVWKPNLAKEYKLRLAMVPATANFYLNFVKNLHENLMNV